MDGLELCCRFALKPNELKYCGPQNAHSVLKNYIQTKTGKKEARAILRGFEALYPYLKLIGEKHELDPFDYSVVEAYWIGNNLLDSFSKSEMENFIRQLRGVYPKIKEKKMPNGAMPYHTFSAFFLGTGWTNDSPEHTKECIVTSGEIVKDEGEKYVVTGQNIYEGGIREEERRVSKLVDAEIGDHVAIHHGQAVCKLTDVQRKNLEWYLARALASIKPISQ